MKKLTSILTLLILLVSCEEPVDWSQKATVNPRLVVEAMITNLPGLNYVKLTLPVSDPNESPLHVISAQVVVTDNEHYYLFREDSLERGTYRPNPQFRAVVNKNYGLFISIGEYEFFGAAYMVRVEPMNPLDYHEAGSHPGYFVIGSSTGNYASMTEYRVEWESEPGKMETKVFYSYILHTVDVNQFFKPDAEWLLFPEGARVIRTRYSLSSDHERYLRSLLSETTWKGGWFDVLPGNLHTNLSSGAVGYFAACSVVRDTTILLK